VPYLKPFIKFLYSAKYVEHLNNYLLTPKGDAIAMRTYKQDVFNETGYADLRIKYGETLDTMTNEFEARAVTGEIDIDAEWDNYVKNWLASGGHEILQAVDNAPIIEELLKGNRVYSDDYP
jgi:hypothetical protein